MVSIGGETCNMKNRLLFYVDVLVEQQYIEVILMALLLIYVSSIVIYLE